MMHDEVYPETSTSLRHVFAGCIVYFVLVSAMALATIADSPRASAPTPMWIEESSGNGG